MTMEMQNARYNRIRRFVYGNLGVDALLEKARVAQGRAIDSAKGVRPPTEAEIGQFAIDLGPRWLRPEDPSGIDSSSPMSNLFAFINGGNYVAADGTMVENYKGRWAEMKDRAPEVNMDRMWLIMEQVPPEELAQALPDVEILESEWRRELGLLSRAREARISECGGENATKYDLDLIEEWWKQEFAELRKRFIANMADLPYSEETKAAAAYFAAYSRHVGGNVRSVSFPWAVCAPGLISLVSRIGQRTQLVPLKELRTVPGEQVRVVNGVAYDFAGNQVGKVNLMKDGVYPTFSHDGRWFVKVPNNRPVDTGIGTVAFRIVGLSQFGLDPREAFDLIQAAGGLITVAPIKNRKSDGYSLGVIVAEREIGYVAKEDLAHIRPSAVQVDLTRCEASRSSLQLTGTRARESFQVDRAQVMRRINTTASYWQDRNLIHRLQDFGVLAAHIHWVREALPHVNQIKCGDVIATVELHVPNAVITLRVAVSPLGANGQPVVKAGDGRPELVLVDGIPSEMELNGADAHRAFVNSVLAWVNWEHATMWIRWKTTRTSGQRVQQGR